MVPDANPNNSAADTIPRSSAVEREDLGGDLGPCQHARLGFPKGRAGCWGAGAVTCPRCAARCSGTAMAAGCRWYRAVSSSRAAQRPVQRPVQRPEHHPEHRPAHHPAHHPTHQSVHHPAHHPAHHSLHRPAHHPARSTHPPPAAASPAALR